MTFSIFTGRPFGPRFPKLTEMTPALLSQYRKQINRRRRAKERARLGLPLRPRGRPKAPRGVLADKRSAKACRFVMGIETLAADPCAYCGASNPTTHDHVEPIKSGGEHSLDNLVRACWRCNREKNVQPLLLFLARRALRRAA